MQVRFRLRDCNRKAKFDGAARNIEHCESLCHLISLRDEGRLRLANLPRRPSGRLSTMRVLGYSQYTESAVYCHMLGATY
jgi:hypothetical protein